VWRLLSHTTFKSIDGTKPRQHRQPPAGVNKKGTKYTGALSVVVGKARVAYEYRQQKGAWISTATDVPNPFVSR
jgi:hypothetical protein